MYDIYLFCDKHITFYVDKSYALCICESVSRRLLMRQNHCFSGVAVSLLILYQHRDGFVHSIITEKPKSNIGSNFDKINRP